MKTINKLGITLTLSTVIVLCGACNKEPEPAAGTDATPVPSAQTTTAAEDATRLNHAVSTQAQALGAAAAQGSQQVTGAVQDTAQQATSQAEGLLAKARAYVDEKKYQDAMTTIKQLAGSKLTPEQQKTLEDLQRQVQAGLASIGMTNATSKLNSLLGGQKK